MTRRSLLWLLGTSLTGCLGCWSSKSIFVEYECFLCKGAGTIRCTLCSGNYGPARNSGPNKICKSCGGAGHIQCPTCKGKRKLSNNPLAS
jgi:hypothetical protein